MRRLSDGERVTFEHIIPQTADESVRGSYESAPNLSAAEVILTSEFSHKSDPVCPPYPHTVAYNNLVASCDGSFPDGTSALCCNHRRRDSFAYPVYYHADAGSRIKYLPDGSAIAVSQDSPQEIMIDHAGLNCRILRDIRYLWHQLRTLAEDDLNKCSANADYRRYTLHRPLFVSMDKLDAKLALIDKFTKDNYWAKLMSYKFFYEYFNGKDYSAGQ
jgi:hypothetical protein